MLNLLYIHNFITRILLDGGSFQQSPPGMFFVHIRKHRIYLPNSTDLNPEPPHLSANHPNPGFHLDTGEASIGCCSWAEGQSAWFHQRKNPKMSIPSLKLTFSPIKMVVSNRNLLFQGSTLRGELLVSGRVESNIQKQCPKHTDTHTHTPFTSLYNGFLAVVFIRF